MEESEKKYPRPATRSFKALGTDIDVQIVVSCRQEESPAESDLLEVESRCRQWEKKFSRFDSGSELCQLNANLGKPETASLEMIAICELALEYHKKSQGYFDPRIIGTLENIGYSNDFKDIEIMDAVGESGKNVYKKNLDQDLKIIDGKVEFSQRMDFSGIVKGWIADQISDFLKNKKWKNHLVDCGGDMFFAGKDEAANPWYIDIEGISHEKLLLALSDVGIATTGIGKRKWEKNGLRFHHLINPKDPTSFSFDLKSVTVIAKCVLDADVWAKTLFLMGWEKGREFAKENNLPCVMLSYNGNAWISPAVREYLFK